MTGDQGVDLVVEKGVSRYAIQAKGYHNSVGNGAVQAAVAGMAHYRCNACAVITNSRFTVSAEELALSNLCKLIGEDQIPALVLGRLAKNQPFLRTEQPETVRSKPVGAASESIAQGSLLSLSAFKSDVSAESVSCAILPTCEDRITIR